MKKQNNFNTILNLRIAALNHSDPTMAITDVYIEKDYSLIDKANRKVLDYVKLSSFSNDNINISYI